MFSSFPHRHGEATGKTRDSRRDTWEHQNEHFVRDFLQFSHFVASKSTFSYEFSLERENWQLQNRCFVRGFRQFSTHRTKCHACHGICTLSPLDAALPMRFAKNTQHDTSKVLRLPRKMTMDTSKVLRLPRKLQHIFWKCRKSIAPATQNDFRHVPEHVWMSRSATPATRNEATTRLKPPKRTTSVKLPIGTAIRGSRGRLRTVANGCGRLRTVATTNATSSEHTLSPQTPRVKREPLLRIREKNNTGNTGNELPLNIHNYTYPGPVKQWDSPFYSKWRMAFLGSPYVGVSPHVGAVLSPQVSVWWFHQKAMSINDSMSTLNYQRILLCCRRLANLM